MSIQNAMNLIQRIKDDPEIAERFERARRQAYEKVAREVGLNCTFPEIVEALRKKIQAGNLSEQEIHRLFNSPL